MILRIVNGFLRFFSSIFMSRKHRSRSRFFCDKSDCQFWPESRKQKIISHFFTIFNLHIFPVMISYIYRFTRFKAEQSS